MRNDEQIGFDIEFDDKTQAFLDWVAPEQMESQVRKFLTDTIPGIADYSTDTWWKPPLLTSVLDKSKELFGDWSGFAAPENRDAADQFIRFLGECCIRRRRGMEWTNRPVAGRPLYTDFGPAVHFSDTGFGETPIELAKELFAENYGPKMVDYSIQMAGKAV